MAHRVLQVGVGGFGRGWTKVLAGSDDVELVGIADVSREALDAARAKHNLAEDVCHTSLDEALSELSPEIVVCVTPPEFHREVAEAALSAGAHVITEKPLAGTMEDARAMAEAADAAGRRLAVSQNYRYSAPARTVQELVKTERVGTPGAFAVEFFRGPRFEGSFRRHMPYPLTIDMSIHHYDLIRAILGRDAEWTFARAFNPPWSWYDGPASVCQAFGFEGDVTGTYSASWCSQGAETQWDGDWRIECSEGVIIWEDGLVRAGSSADRLEDVAPLEIGAGGQRGVLAEFVAALAEGREPETSARDNLRSLGMVFGTVESSESGGVVNL
ncbi:MAG: Gfo/Idh/MocA family protein [Planctomycetota bacterium]